MGLHGTTVAINAFPWFAPFGGGLIYALNRSKKLTPSLEQMNPNSDFIKKLNVSDGWDIGTAPSLVVVDQGISKSLTAVNTQSGIYAFFFDQQGLMGGIELQGTKVTRMRVR